MSMRGHSPRAGPNPLVAAWQDPNWWDQQSPYSPPRAASRTPPTSARRAATPPPGYAVSHAAPPNNDSYHQQPPASADDVRYGAPVRYSKPPLPDEARYGSPTTPRSYDGMTSPRASSSVTGAVRPQWTEHTTAGRAKLAVDADNWEWAERTRRLRTEREDYCGQFRNHVKTKNAFEASAARQERQQALHEVRASVKSGIEYKGLQGKREVDMMRQRTMSQRQAWQEYGRQLHAVHNNEGARAQRVAMHLQRGDNCERMKRERERHERARAAEISAHFANKRERAERMRSENVKAVQSVSAAELRSRQRDVDQMRHAEVRREGHRAEERQHVLTTHREYRDAVYNVASREVVAEHNAAERARKAAHAAHMRSNMRRLRQMRMADVLGEAERKRAMHDEVLRERIDGPAPSGVGYAHYGPLALSGGPRSAALGFALDGVKKLVGGGYGYSTDSGRPNSPPRHGGGGRPSYDDDLHDRRHHLQDPLEPPLAPLGYRASSPPARPRRAASPPARFEPPPDYYNHHHHLQASPRYPYDRYASAQGYSPHARGAPSPPPPPHPSQYERPPSPPPPHHHQHYHHPSQYEPRPSPSQYEPSPSLSQYEPAVEFVRVPAPSAAQQPYEALQVPPPAQYVHTRHLSPSPAHRGERGGGGGEVDVERSGGSYMERVQRASSPVPFDRSRAVWA